ASGVTEIAGALEIFPTADGVPVARGVHALPPVVGRGPEVLGPEELFPWLVNQHRVMRDGAAVVVQIMRTFGVGVVGPTLGGEIAFVVNDEVVLIQVIVFGQVGTRIEFYPGRIGPEAVAHDEVADAAK